MKRTAACLLFLVSFIGNQNLCAQPFAKDYVLGASTTWQVVKPTQDGNLITIGDYTASETSPNVIQITKLQPDGSVVWSKTYGGDIQQNGLNITETTDGGFVIAGVEFVFDFTTNEFLAKGCLIKLSEKGERLWSHYLEYGNQNYFLLTHVAATPDGGVIAGGNFQQFAGGSVGSYVYVAKIDAAGTPAWAKQFDTKGYRRWIADISIAKRVVTVVSESAIGSGVQAQDAAAITLMNESDGSVIGSKRLRLNGSRIHFIQTAGPSADGGIVISGTTGNGIGDFDIWTCKVNDKLNLQWSNVISQGNDDRPNKIISVANGVTILGAVSSNADNFFNPYLIWLDNDGNQIQNQLLPQPSRGVFGLASLGNTTYALMNQQFGTGSNSYTGLYAWQGTTGVCSASAQAGNWHSAPDVTTDNQKTKVTDINTVVSDMNYEIADVLPKADDKCSPVLPVQFVFLTGTYNTGSVILNWRTASELNTALFTIERSSDGGSHYMAVGTVAAHGSSGAAYTFTDNALPGGNVVYRIQTKDKDGRENYSSSVAIAVPGVKQAFVYPSPAKSKVTVMIHLSKPVALQMNIMTVDGRIVLRQTVAGSVGTLSQVLDVANLKGGVYFIRITGIDETTILRFVKE